MVWHKDSLVSTAKATHTSKANSLWFPLEFQDSSDALAIYQSPSLVPERSQAQQGQVSSSTVQQAAKAKHGR